MDNNLLGSRTFCNLDKRKAARFSEEIRKANTGMSSDKQC